MACDIFTGDHARVLLQEAVIYFFGGSNMRALYKDLLWLLEDGRLISGASLKTRNEPSFASDTRLSNDTLHRGVTYKEIRHYIKNEIDIRFYFLTRLYLPHFFETIENLERTPHIIVINSTTWDISRWGPGGVNQFKVHLLQTFSYLQKKLPTTRIIWITATPPRFKSLDSSFSSEMIFLRRLLPYNVVYGNQYASDVANSCNIDVLDLHYIFKFLFNYHTKDGIHWNPKAMRLATNMLLTHIALAWNRPLPGYVHLDDGFLKQSTCYDPVLTPTMVFKCQKLEAVLKKWGKNADTRKNINTCTKRTRHMRITRLREMPLFNFRI